MDPPRFEFIHEMFADEPELEADAQERFLAYLRLVDRIATRQCRDDRDPDNSV